MASHGDDEQDALRDGREGGLPKAHVIGDDETALGDTPEVHAEISPHDFPKGAPERQAAEQMAEEEDGEGTRGARGSERARGSRPASVAHPRRIDSLRAWPSARSSSTCSARSSTGARAWPGVRGRGGRRRPHRARRRLARPVRAGARGVQQRRAPGGHVGGAARGDARRPVRRARDGRGRAGARQLCCVPGTSWTHGRTCPRDSSSCVATESRRHCPTGTSRCSSTSPATATCASTRSCPPSSPARTSPRRRCTSGRPSCSPSSRRSSCSSPRIRSTSRAPAAPGCGRRSSTARSSTARDRPPSDPEADISVASLPELAERL